MGEYIPLGDILVLLVSCYLHVGQKISRQIHQQPYGRPLTWLLEIKRFWELFDFLVKITWHPKILDFYPLPLGLICLFTWYPDMLYFYPLHLGLTCSLTYNLSTWTWCTCKSYLVPWHPWLLPSPPGLPRDRLLRQGLTKIILCWLRSLKAFSHFNRLTALFQFVRRHFSKFPNWIW